VQADGVMSPSGARILPFVANGEPAVYRFRYRHPVINRLLEKP
jgi:hypothetical protein